jgi:ABC-type phosphate/phosphonate transport system substrate-binding protein
MPLASLPMYDLAEARPATNALWQELCRAFQREGLTDPPGMLTRGAPAIAQWGAPDLFFSQCCGYDLLFGFASALQPLAMPRYEAATGCISYDYRSCIIVREESAAATIGDLRGTVCAINGFNSYSGTGALRALVAPLSRNGRFFRGVKVSGSHVRSAEMVRIGNADTATIDCVTYAMLARYRPRALAGLRILAETDPAPAPPYVTRLDLPAEMAARIRTALVSVLCRRPRPACCEDLFIDGTEPAVPADYARLLAADEIALKLHYQELYPSGPALLRTEAAPTEEEPARVTAAQ